MKITLNLPNDVIRNAKATAAVRGESLRDFVTAAIEARLRSHKSAHGHSGWKSLFGLARRSDVAAIDRIVSRDLETIDLAEWR